ncbi:uncharacterized protein LACBIDRAFT_299606 [Laccaria bicolor S238N-H82]|uniref:DNA-(apurinic or apyrimidinic site) endonuclease 2 n=1 Tax=Laccaria bicolor (strain S238N-H82 / ATCC MYA-4686) TaxID=486041 RepID=B0DEY8_LACBS|nr:uncharacterized protein LACBIDRAFT_299606 [Laccaria bicolor S238N-H82]EDR06754.1 predicted protein [Laccaria bicolor S238N-H82]|eukprot:XP_001882601.1 predicted protein [Laccaria bicolor S238N-H82]
MRILTWNINGVRTLPQYHPWNTLKAHDDILNHLEADIICFQEMKSSRPALPKQVAVPPSYDSFFSFPIRKSGYSGVATYTRHSAVIPLKAEEGLSGVLQPKPPLTAAERISDSDNYPPNAETASIEGDLDYADLDSEGRTVILDLGLFVLINVYCPNDGNGTEERDKYKMDFHRLLEMRVVGLIKEGREVMVVGDLNACAAIIDHCEGHLMVAKGLAEGLQGEEGFWGKDSRRWMRGFLVPEDEGMPGGFMIDIVRKLWPERKGMYTCWNTKISARDSNYGTRIDYILITRGLLPWVKAADIQPLIKGSDHCPVYVDLFDEITDPTTGAVVELRRAMGLQDDGRKDPPRLAARFWDEYSGKQTQLHKFFGQKSKGSGSSDTPCPALVPSPSPIIVDDNNSATITPSSTPIPTTQTSTSGSSTTKSSPVPSSPLQQPSSSQPRPPSSSPPPVPISTKRKLVADIRSTSKKRKQREEEEKKPSQQSIASFFAKPMRKPKDSLPPASSSIKAKGKQRAPEGDVDLEEDYQFALQLSQLNEPLVPSKSQSKNSKSHGGKGTAEWTNLLAPIQPPKCIVHGELAKELTVTKQGANKGKRFFICARPVGPGYDKGRGERLREHVDPHWKCDFFKWSSEVRREMVRNGNSGADVGVS